MTKFYFLIVILSFQFSTAQIRFQKLADPAHFPSRTVSQTITATIPYQGYDEGQAYLGMGDYEIFLDTSTGVLDKPIIILDGFDPGDSRGIGDIYASLSFGGENLADILRNEGFDIIILNAPQYTTAGKLIDGGSDYIQRNAMVLISLIEKINTDKVGEEEIVVLGPSMGGLIARYGLAYMETNNLEADTRLFISFDAPHRGANIPISLQYLINYFAQSMDDPTAQEVISQLLNSPAAKEMLVDHLTGHLLSGSTFEQDPTKLLPMGFPGFRAEFQGELDALGFPANVRNVTMINGSGTGVSTGTPGMSVIDSNIAVDALTSVDIAVKFTPEAGVTNTATDVTLRFLGLPIGSFSAYSKSPSFTDGVDSAPGGTGSISDALGDGQGNQFLIDFIAALQQDLYSFIPTMSSLAIDNLDWFATPNLSDSPFDAFYIPTENQPHVTMTEGGIQFALDEIRNGVVGISDNAIDHSFFWVENPVGNTININLLDSNFSEKISATVFNFTGQKVMSETFLNPGAKINWSHNLSSGLYLLKLENGISAQTIKLVVR